MNFLLDTKLGKAIFSKILTKKAKTVTGFDIDIIVDELHIVHSEEKGKIQFKVSVFGSMDQDIGPELLQRIGLI